MTWVMRMWAVFRHTSGGTTNAGGVASHGVLDTGSAILALPPALHSLMAPPTIFLVAAAMNASWLIPMTPVVARCHHFDSGGRARDVCEHGVTYALIRLAAGCVIACGSAAVAARRVTTSFSLGCALCRSKLLLL